MHGRQRKRYSLESFCTGGYAHFVEWNEELENRILIELLKKALKVRKLYHGIENLR